MSRPAAPVPVLPPTPEDETNMAQLQPGGGRAKAIQGLDHASKDNGSVDIVVNTPASPSSSLVLSRFEFEPDKGNEGTKVLMVEWDDSGYSTTLGARDIPGKPTGDNTRQDFETTPENDWMVIWEGKDNHNVLAASDNAASLASTARRTYFLLPPGTTVPPLVRITRGSRVCVGSGKESEATDLWTKPMPAIYPTSLGSDAGRAGGRGVLHTLWAKHRLAGLEAEIEAEMKANSESIGLQIALQEHDWVSDHFGIGEPSGLRTSPPYMSSPASPTASRAAMPRSPIGGKLGEKLKGLRLATSPAELAAALQVKTAASSTCATVGTQSTRALDEPVSVGTRLGLRTSIESHNGVHNSLDAVISDSQAVNNNARVDDNSVDADAEDELFALPLSPRSPEMPRSPFSLL
ncbi:hypothetical protein Sste5346_007557 [Sporothrix stenoceras]|uniref:Uncharacterized protein n=1 Tax=Sporothrix stenoceras TaxID=5173 RepID=A0ABR3YUS5_9PEZI